MFPNLFSALRLGNVETKNRIWFLGHRTNFGKMGLLTDRHIAYYRRRAKGGCGVIIVGELSIHPNDRPLESMIEAYHPEIVKRYQKLTASAHEFGATVLAQLNFHGYQSSGEITRKPIWGPSPIADIVHGETAKEMEPEDIETVTNAFADAAVLAREGGFDGVEIDMGHDSILRQFLSPLSNLRQDHYGGSFENRMRFPLKVVDEVAKRAGRDFLLGIRLCADEMFWGAITIDESRNFARIFEATGDVDYINTTIGSHYNHLYLILATMHTPKGFTIELSRQIKESVGIPVIAGYQINSPSMAEEVIAGKKADAVGFARPLICDPDFPNKSAGQADRIRFCIMDNEGCIGRLNQNKTLSCTQNPDVGYESLSGNGEFNPAMTKKKVIVIGAGPAGLEAARVARLRGHDVTIYEAAPDPGGQINIILKRPLRHPIKQIIHNLIYSIHDLGIELLKGENISSQKVVEMKPDAVIVATGSRPIARPVKGEYGPPEVLNVHEMLQGKYPVGPRVLFIDEHGGHYAAATAEMMVDQGMSVHMITSDLFIGIELAPMGDLYLSRQTKMKELAKLQKEIADIQNLKELSLSGNLKEAEKLLNEVETLLYFSGPYDSGSAIMELHSGQGGVEAMDWTNMLYRMYTRFFDKKGWAHEVIDETPGEEAGLKSITIQVVGEYAYGFLKHEAGVHRLVRQSPFNADNLRQTSFALVEVMPEIEESAEIEIKDEDLDWDFYRSGGHGGQNVNKVSTAVRLKHIPTGIVVTAQSQRYQGQNREYALKILRAKLWFLQEEERKKQEANLKADTKLRAGEIKSALTFCILTKWSRI